MYISKFPSIVHESYFFVLENLYWTWSTCQMPCYPYVKVNKVKVSFISTQFLKGFFVWGTVVVTRYNWMKSAGSVLIEHIGKEFYWSKPLPQRDIIQKTANSKPDSQWLQNKCSLPNKCNLQINYIWHGTCTKWRERT